MASYKVYLLVKPVGVGSFAVAWGDGEICAVVLGTDWWWGDSLPPPAGTTLIG